MKARQLIRKSTCKPFLRSRDTARHYKKASKLYYDRLAPHVMQLSRLCPQFSGCYSSGSKKSASCTKNQEAFKEACQARDRFGEIYHVR
jgi:hypothetical protein